MRSSLSGSVVLVALAAAPAAAFYGCSSSTSDGGGSPFGVSGAAGTPVGTAGSTAAAGSVGVSGGAGAPTSTAGAGGGSTGGAGGASTGGASTGGASTGGASTGGATGMSGASGLGDITKVVPTAGCGMAPPAGITPGQTSGKQTIMTMGTKDMPCADSNCAPWQYTREYYVTLPTGYDKSKAYPLVLEGPGCGGQGTDVYPLTGTTGPNVNNTVIRVGLTPPPLAIGHATNPVDHCFDDKEGDDSVDWVFYENLYDKLSGQLCFDRNRVFSAGDSSGSWFSNELGCKYAGDTKRPVRGILPNTGGLPSEKQYEPTCTTKPLAGMWVHEIGDTTNPFTGNKFAIARAMSVNGCTMGTSYDNATLVDFPIGGGKPDNTCKKIMGCPDLYPLVVCALPGVLHQSHADVTNPGFSTFLTMFEKAPLLTP